MALDKQVWNTSANNTNSSHQRDFFSFRQNTDERQTLTVVKRKNLTQAKRKLTYNLVPPSEDFENSKENSPLNWQIFCLPASNDRATRKCDPRWKNWQPDK